MAAKKIRIHELAKELGMTNAEVLDLCNVLGVAAKGPSSSLAEAYAQMVTRRAERDGHTRDKQPEESTPVKKAAPEKAAPRKAPAVEAPPRRSQKKLSFRRAAPRSAADGPTVSSEDWVRRLIAAGESRTVEFKQTARTNVEGNRPKDKGRELDILKTIAGFLNTDGGTLLIGVTDSGEVSGIEIDLPTVPRKNLDGFGLWLTNLISTRIGVIAAHKSAISFHVFDDKTVCLVTVEPGGEPSYVTADTTDFYVRLGGSTQKFNIAQAVSYTKQHWP